MNQPYLSKALYLAKQQSKYDGNTWNTSLKPITLFNLKSGCSNDF